MDVTVKIKRFDPDADHPRAEWQEYPLSVDENATVLDALIVIREEMDGTLSLRCSCRSAICGSCAMRINGHAGLACKTKASESMDGNGVIVVEPAGVMGQLKDLVVDFDLFWRKIEQVEPFLQPQGPEPEAEYIASNESMLHLSGVTACIMCGACVSDCTVLEVDPTFLGPAALAKAYRFTADPRDGDQNGVSRERLSALGEVSGMWDCTRCSECVQACPQRRCSHGPHHGPARPGHGGRLLQQQRGPPRQLLHRVRRKKRPSGRVESFPSSPSEASPTSRPCSAICRWACGPSPTARCPSGITSWPTPTPSAACSRNWTSPDYRGYPNPRISKQRNAPTNIRRTN